MNWTEVAFTLIGAIVGIVIGQVVKLDLRRKTK
jgi:hypothetical protein